MKAELRTWLLEDRGYDCNEHRRRWYVTDYSLLAAIRQLDGFGAATYAQPINDVRGCSTYAVYADSKTGTFFGGWAKSKIGVVYVIGQSVAG